MSRRDIFAGILIISLISGALAPFASNWPDGLEWVAEKLHFQGAANGAIRTLPAPLADYAVPGIRSEKISTGLAGLIGSSAVFLLSLGLAWGLNAKKRTSPGWSK